ncbi:ThiJ/PfpI [Massariosphaeria phaeospora]|uniref:ThiJ/PfpI n=1 Tax=Massariosphaeria phaeospora TaxID=100035 RepID=A0A7C8MB60_9PLEO|nr:ThiJ/PfpI [Massariosphaeria phaeospora]
MVASSEWPEVDFLRNPDRTLRAGVILMGGETEVIDVMPIDLLHGISKKFLGDFKEVFGEENVEHGLDIEFHWVNETGKTAKLTSNIKIEPTDSFDTCPPLDIVLVGAHNSTHHTLTQAELAYLRKAYEESKAFITVCGGMMPALEAGILAGKTATAPLMLLDHLKQNTGTTWEAKRYVRDGKLWTSGALFNGVDLIRAFVLHVWGTGEKKKMVEFCLDFGSVPVRSVDY